MPVCWVCSGHVGCVTMPSYVHNLRGVNTVCGADVSCLGKDTAMYQVDMVTCPACIEWLAARVEKSMVGCNHRKANTRSTTYSTVVNTTDGGVVCTGCNMSADTIGQLMAETGVPWYG